MKTLEKINKKIEQQQKVNHLQTGLIWIGLQFSLGKITKREYKTALKNAKKYKKEI